VEEMVQALVLRAGDLLFWVCFRTRNTMRRWERSGDTFDQHSSQLPFTHIRMRMSGQSLLIKLSVCKPHALPQRERKWKYSYFINHDFFISSIPIPNLQLDIRGTQHSNSRNKFYYLRRHISARRYRNGLDFGDEIVFGSLRERHAIRVTI